MAEPEFTIEEQNEAASSKDLAMLRWHAVWAANGAPDLSPMARRVLIAMICVMDAKTRACFPSELWIAETIGVHVISVKKAKAELRDKHGLIHWTNPGGPRHQSRYIFNWQKLVRLSQETRKKGAEAVTERKGKTASQGSRTATMAEHSNGSHTTTLDDFQSSHTATMEQAPKVAASQFQGSQNASQGSRTAMPKVAAPLPEHSYYHLSLEHESGNTTRRASGVAEQRRAESPPLSALDQHDAALKKKEVALEEAKPIAQPKRGLGTCPYPNLVEAFADMPNVMSKLLAMDADGQMEVSKLLATKGKARAAAFAAKAEVQL